MPLAARRDVRLKASPATSSGAAAPANDAKDNDAIDPETGTSGGDAGDPEPEHAIDTLDVSLFARWASAEPTAGVANTRSSTALGGSELVYDEWSFDEGYVARKTNPMHGRR